MYYGPASNGLPCDCIREMEQHCRLKNLSGDDVDNLLGLMNPTKEEADFGRMIYTIAILLMFSFVIVLLMIRSIKRSSSAIEIEALLDVMRFREELDMRERQRRRLMKAKNKVTMWLTKTRDWKSSPQLSNPPNNQPRKHTSASTASDVPAIIVTEEEQDDNISRSRTPALSLIYDFSYNGDTNRYNGSTRPSVCSQSDISLKDSFGSRASMSLDLDTCEDESRRQRLSLGSHSLSVE
ncbi:hypothetical protein WR25_24511 isoform A [Diploscapter pachys]|uniref:Uncharacterized protein n=1 Tax=Diploscapter pachys TaxID=2018661 RepID=A0A2A2L856_9BILA|nr:hypothetical protein WR25_24511 isoform A [Diploscapter pachys]